MIENIIISLVFVELFIIQLMGIWIINLQKQLKEKKEIIHK